MVRVSIPTLPPAPLVPPNALTLLPTPQAASHLARFLEKGNGKTVILTGAGVSVDSGIRAYRGKEGSYSNPNYKPILFHELVEDTPRGEMFRRRYWARSFLGYPPVRDAQPNPTHIYIAALLYLGLAPNLITQNVDNLHPKAYRLLSPNTKPPILELHGTLAKVHCMKHRHEQSRDEYQEQISRLNPIWDEAAKEAERTGTQPRTNPDGDVDLRGANYNTFNVPSCRICEAEGEKPTMVKPNVVFFGETIPPVVRDESFSLINSASSLLILGTSLATYSAFRLVKLALDQKKPVLMISTGPSRADGLPGLEKMDRVAGDVLGVYLDSVVKGNRGMEFDAVRKILHTGVIKPIPQVDGPRAEG
ncbi:hypothetical protein LQV05_005514 [Cryptococcus neoformans]|nr:hypothetical protein C356_04298 [Cryptococcus neoformans var. grubii c45]OXB36076.1 hypothetical protein J007_04223 [Cryptococcus neoformans var. grubii]OXC60236.1 hypothetical protein C358_04338 [Cryptococcus neoformans var. grubii MW-RSA852]UOH82803.1 hypothetical protein LQV05_005514 [Cryptococcus neoformans]